MAQVNVRVLIDTNVLLSGIFWPGKSKALLNAVRQGEIHYITSKHLLDELQGVLSDPTKPFGLNDHEIDKIINEIRTFAEIIVPTSHIEVCRDPDDNRVLECAIDGEVDYIITGDKDILVLDSFEGIKIITVDNFLRLHL